MTLPTHIRTCNLDELANAVNRVYCPSLTVFARPRGTLPGVLKIGHAGLQPLVELRYGTPARVDAGEFPGLVLMRTCINGGGAVHQQGVSAILRKGETLPMSAGLRTQVELDAHFAQRSVKFDIARLEQQCARMLNHPLDRALRFDLQPFSAALERAWTEAVSLAISYADMNLDLPAAAAANLDDFLISLVLTQHQHNYTDELQARDQSLPPRLVREAEQLMRTADAELTATGIAAHLRVSLRSLQAGFRDYRSTTPQQRLRAIRLERVRERLRSPLPGTSVTSAALECGFVHLARFSGYYKAAFGESPAQTLRRSRMTRAQDAARETG